MAIRLLSTALLAIGGLLSGLLYLLLPTARSVACIEQAACPGTPLSHLLARSALPLIVAIVLVAVASAAHRRYPGVARVMLVVPIAVGAVWVGGFLISSFLGGWFGG